jgi:hypothetical protein
MTPLEIPTEFSNETRDALYNGFTAKLAELEALEATTDMERELIALCHGLFLFAFWSQ